MCLQWPWRHPPAYLPTYLPTYLSTGVRGSSSPSTTGVFATDHPGQGQSVSQSVSFPVHIFHPFHSHTYLFTYLPTYLPTYIHLPTSQRPGRPALPYPTHTYLPTYLHTGLLSLPTHPPAPAAPGSAPLPDPGRSSRLRQPPTSVVITSQRGP